MAIGNLPIENYVPAIKLNDGLYTEKDIETTGNLIVGGDITLTDDISVESLSVTGTATVTSASASALAVGLNGATTPAFSVDSSTASQAAGLKVTGATTTGTVAVETIGGAAVNLTLNAKGTGTIGIGSVSTGAVTVTPATTVTGVLTATAGVTSPASVATKSATAVPASAGAVAAGPAVSMFSTPISLWVTSDAPAFSAQKGDICINTGGSSSSTRLYINNGTTNWVAITTAT